MGEIDSPLERFLRAQVEYEVAVRRRINEAVADFAKAQEATRRAEGSLTLDEVAALLPKREG